MGRGGAAAPQRYTNRLPSSLWCFPSFLEQGQCPESHPSSSTPPPGSLACPAPSASHPGYLKGAPSGTTVSPPSLSSLMH